MLAIVDLQLCHVLQVVHVMRPEDAACVRAATGDLDLDGFAVNRFQAYGPAWALVDADQSRAWAIGGLQLVNDWTGVLWIVASEGMPSESWRKLTRKARTLLTNACDPAHPLYLHRVEAHVLASWSAARRFASKGLGLELESVKRAAGSGGEDIEVWTRVGPVKG